MMTVENTVVHHVGFKVPADQDYRQIHVQEVMGSNK